YCLGLMLLEVGYLTGLVWLNGKMPVGSIDLRHVFLAAIAPYFLWVRFHLDHVAGAALNPLRPALSSSATRLTPLRSELTTLPARTTRIVTAISVGVFLANAILRPTGIMRQYASSVKAGILELGPIGLFTVAVVAVGVAQAVHQLAMVNRIHD